MLGNAIHSSVALRMGFKSMTKVTEPNYDEYLNKLKAEIDDILNVFSEFIIYCSKYKINFTSLVLPFKERCI